ncbi:hypothetical protein HK103_000216 [Boothiomyces macroporosus]|uniref:Uncharacterized protein n=1 Tax=Boothiomyces macroporosus TaxID=261099 RepID=A0AAD5UL82_9FUNG|nr:hypothetical protein HK103_000216 [Boothiomyces macroporosus]
MSEELKIQTVQVPSHSADVLITPEAPPRASRELQASESVLRKRNVLPQVSNVADGYHFDELIWHGSVMPSIIVPVTFFTLWGTLWTLLYQLVPLKNIAMSPTLITILFWEARRLWGTLFAHVRNLARVTWIAVKHDGKKELLDKYGNINLLLAFAVACKHYLRFEYGHHYEDLHHLLVHLPEFKPGQYHAYCDNLPLQISFYISTYNNRCRAKERCDVPTTASMIAALSGMVDVLSNFERIRDCPLPIAYTVHLKQTLLLYLLLLPFQLVSTLNYWTIVVTFAASFTFLGIAAIGREIENPFGYDDNDLRMDLFCERLKNELEQLVDSPNSLLVDEWSTPVDIANFEKMRSVSEKK